MNIATALAISRVLRVNSPAKRSFPSSRAFSHSEGETRSGKTSELATSLITPITTCFSPVLSRPNLPRVELVSFGRTLMFLRNKLWVTSPIGRPSGQNSPENCPIPAKPIHASIHLPCAAPRRRQQGRRTEHKPSRDRTLNPEFSQQWPWDRTSKVQGWNGWVGGLTVRPAK